MQTPTDAAGKPLTKNQHLLDWVDEMARLTKPDRVVWCDGSDEEKHRLTEEAVAKGILIAAEPAEAARLLPPPLATRTTSRASSSSRSSARPTKDEAGPTNNWMAPDEAYKKLGALFDGSMKGRTMYVVPYVMGPLGSPTRKVGVELTDSIYVVLNMRIMTRMGEPALRACSATRTTSTAACTRCSTATPSAASSATSPQDNTIWSVGSGLRRQRAARQEVPGAAHRQLPRPAARAGWPSTCSSSASNRPRAR